MAKEEKEEEKREEHKERQKKECSEKRLGIVSFLYFQKNNLGRAVVKGVLRVAFVLHLENGLSGTSVMLLALPALMMVHSSTRYLLTYST